MKVDILHPQPLPKVGVKIKTGEKESISLTPEFLKKIKKAFFTKYPNKIEITFNSLFIDSVKKLCYNALTNKILEVF